MTWTSLKDEPDWTREKSEVWPKWGLDPASAHVLVVRGRWDSAFCWGLWSETSWSFIFHHMLTVNWRWPTLVSELEDALCPHGCNRFRMTDWWINIFFQLISASFPANEGSTVLISLQLFLGYFLLGASVCVCLGRTSVCFSPAASWFSYQMICLNVAGCRHLLWDCLWWCLLAACSLTGYVTGYNNFV